MGDVSKPGRDPVLNEPRRFTVLLEPHHYAILGERQRSWQCPSLAEALRRVIEEAG